MSADTHERLTVLFTEAIGLPPSGRARLVARVRESDHSLAEELTELLAADASLDASFGADAIAHLVSAPVLDPGLIPGYRLLSVLGEGSMGTVYAAEQRSPRRPVGIKVLHAASKAAIARFHTEAAIMARLDHPGIARVLEAGDAGGRPFLVMEYVEGETLDRHVRSLPRARRVELAIAICDAVEHAHRKGVIHRDLKPSNVMVRPDGRIAVLDFGVARLAGDGDRTLRGTRAGELIGTPLYMSPEQAHLRPDQVDECSDVYTLGVLLYELLCEQLPHDVRGLPLARVTSVICDDEPVALGKRDRALRGDLEAITHKALRKNPGERYPSAASLAEDLRRHLHHLPVSVRTPGMIERCMRLVRRRPLAASLIAAGLLAAATCAITVAWLWLDARAARRVSEATRSRSEATSSALDARTSELILREARAVVVSDPTEAVAWLATMKPRDVDTDAAWMIADEAFGRGVALDIAHAHRHEVRWIEAFRDGERFVTGGYDGRVVLWEPPDHLPSTVFQVDGRRVQIARPSPDGARIAIGGDDGEVDVIARDGSAVEKLVGHAGKVERLAWSRVGDLATGDDLGNVWFWPQARAPGRHLQASSAVIGSVDFSASGESLVASDKGGAVWLWDLASGTLRAAATDAEEIDTWTDDRRVLSVDARGTVHAWHVDGGALVSDGATVTGVATKRAVFAGDGSSVVLGGVGGAAIRVAGKAIETIATHRAQVRYIALTPEGQRIATASDDGEIQVAGGRVTAVAIANGTVVTATTEGKVTWWRVVGFGVRRGRREWHSCTTRGVRSIGTVTIDCSTRWGLTV